MKFKLIEDIYEGERVKFFTNGVKTIKLKPGDEIPEGFYMGRTFKSNPWNKGLTAETDERVKIIGQSTKKTRLANNNYHSWNTGLTKENNATLKAISSKLSAYRKGKEPWNKGIPMRDEVKVKISNANKGKTAWNKGLTKETNDSIKSTSNKLKGHECFVKDWDLAKQKEYDTKKKNKSFNTSKLEKEFIDALIKEHGEENVIHPYRDNRYPFNCDAYVVPLDLFIEVNGTIEHHGHPFDKNNEDDVKKAQRIFELASSRGQNSRYWNILKWWTEIDPKKLETFRKNNLNFKIIYPNGLIIDK